MNVSFKIPLFFVSTLLLVPVQTAYSQDWKVEEVVEKHSYVPSDGYVPDEATASAIAEAVLVPIYGKTSIERQKPFLVGLDGDVWTVSGQLRKQPNRLVLGGVFRNQISKQDASIKFLSHGK
jgi:hypothetical protein